MKRLSMVLLVAVTALALLGSRPIVMSTSGCSPLDPVGSTSWCMQ